MTTRRKHSGVTALDIGSLTNYVEVSTTGDVVFVGTSGLAFGEIYAHSAAADITSVAQNDWDQITAFDTDGLSNNATPDHTNDHITITKAGKYLVTFHWCGSSAAVPHIWAFHIAKNNNGVTFNNVVSHVTNPVGGRNYSVSATGIIDLAVDDTVELWVKRVSAGANIVLTTDNCLISLTQIGG